MEPPNPTVDLLTPDIYIKLEEQLKSRDSARIRT
jgi:hypothetical protein